MKWKSLTGLILIIIATVMNWIWIWGVLFLFWVLLDIFNGKTYFLEEVDKKGNPILYWAIMISWFLLSLYFFSGPLGIWT